MKIDQERVVKELETLGKIGFVPGEGTSRVAYSSEYFEGRDYVQSLMEEAGLEIEIDAVGNLIGTRRGKAKPGMEKPAKKIAVASHLDTVPGGGIYDGTLGVMSAIECVRAMDREGYENQHDIEVIAFIEEEGNAVGGTFGSKCIVGEAPTEDEIRRGKAFGLTEADFAAAKRDCSQYKAYLELHIEQGGVLEAEKLDIGIVEGIVGVARYHGQGIGESNHAGTTTMALRKDAMTRSVIMLDDLYKRVASRDDGMVCTIGIFSIASPAVNVVPGKTEFQVETRHKNMETQLAVIEEWRKDYEDKGLILERFLRQDETLMDPALTDLCETLCQKEGLSYKRMFSGAGHDAMRTANVIPCAMIFIPSIGGISHNPKEYSTPEDIGKGTLLLLEMMKAVDQDA